MRRFLSAAFMACLVASSLTGTARAASVPSAHL